MAYHFKTKQRAKQAAKTAGTKLGKLAVAKNLSVQQIATITGASRPTVYSWFAGGSVSNAYIQNVLVLTRRLREGTEEQLLELQTAEAYIPPLLLI